jgi:hypothetical protein
MCILPPLYWCELADVVSCSAAKREGVYCIRKWQDVDENPFGIAKISYGYVSWLSIHKLLADVPRSCLSALLICSHLRRRGKSVGFC